MKEQKHDSEEQSFRQELEANPSDDNARMVYADWLETQGELPRAEFLRRYCAGLQSMQIAD